MLKTSFNPKRFARLVISLAALSCLLVWPTATFAEDEVKSRCLCYFKVADLIFKQDLGNYCKILTPVSELASRDKGLTYCLAACRDVGVDIDPKYYSTSIISHNYIEDTTEASETEKRVLKECEDRAFTGVSIDTTPATTSYVVPQPSVAIPGLIFSEPLRRGNKLSIDYIGTYFSAVYRWLLGASLTVAIVMVMIGGIQYVISAGRGDVSEAKQRITNAVVGFVLLLSTYVILYTVNPELTVLGPIVLQPIPTEPLLPYGEGEEDFVNGAAPPADLVNAVAGNIINSEPLSGRLVSKEVAAAVEAAAGELSPEYGMIISSGYRSVAKQVALIQQNCQNPPGSQYCNKKPGRPSTCILRNNDPKNCPHTTARAIDAWGAKQYDGQWHACISQKDCLANLGACFADPCQSAVIDAMKAQGFCVLSSEPWHFEKPKMSSTCR